MLHARGLSSAELQQQHVDRLHRHTIRTTPAGMAHANGPMARATVNSTSSWWGQEQRVVLNFVLVVVVVSHIQRIGCQPEKTTLHGGQSRSWSAEQGKEKSLAAYPPPPPPRRRYNPKGDGCYLSTDRLRMCNMYQ